MVFDFIWTQVGGEAREMKKWDGNYKDIKTNFIPLEKCIVYSYNLHPGKDSHMKTTEMLYALRLPYG